MSVASNIWQPKPYGTIGSADRHCSTGWPSFRLCPTMPSSGPTAQRRTRGYASLILAVAGLATVTGVAVWYLRESNLLDQLWSPTNRRPKNRKKKAVVVIVDEVPIPHQIGSRSMHCSISAGGFPLLKCLVIMLSFTLYPGRVRALGMMNCTKKRNILRDFYTAKRLRE
jgi:hypothetical protein